MITDEFLEGVALGLHALDSKLWKPAQDTWTQLTKGERDSYRARARFVLSYADPTALNAGR